MHVLLCMEPILVMFHWIIRLSMKWLFCIVLWVSQYWCCLYCERRSTGAACAVSVTVLVLLVLWVSQYWCCLYCERRSTGAACIVSIAVLVLLVLTACDQFWRCSFIAWWQLSTWRMAATTILVRNTCTRDFDYTIMQRHASWNWWECLPGLPKSTAICSCMTMGVAGNWKTRMQRVAQKFCLLSIHKYLIYVNPNLGVKWKRFHVECSNPLCSMEMIMYLVGCIMCTT